MKRKVQLLATGGTIASGYASDTRDVRVSASADDLMASVADRLADFDVVGVDVLNMASFEMDLDIAHRLVSTVGSYLEQPDIAGVVVTHGTDTLEETAYLADLVLESDKPVVFTGAQLPADAPAADGPRNLADAIQLAACEQARGLGALVVFDSEIHFARDVAKRHTSRLSAFESPEFGKAGEVDGGRVILHRRPSGRHVFAQREIEPRVDLIKLAIGADNRFIDCAVGSGTRGIVLETFGRGNATPKVLAAVERAVASGVVVIVTSRCGRGRVEPVYGGSGGAGLARAGALFGEHLTGVKARVLLSVLLGSGGSRCDVMRGLRCLTM